MTVHDFCELGKCSAPVYLAIGVFDGVHLGHQAVIESAVHSARQSGGIAAVLTFTPHPSRIFRPDEPTLLLMPMAQKAERLRKHGVDCVIEKTFDRKYASISALDFLKSLKDAMPTLAAVYVGENFRFGKKRSGDVNTLIQTGAKLGIAVFSAERINYNGEPISSTRIRSALAEGAIAQVNQLLGYNYTAFGTVMKGKQLGRTLDFPTLNLPWSPESRPRFGVYAARVALRNTQDWQPGIANYGLRPTVEAGVTRPLLETHVFNGPCAIDYGDEVAVQLLDFVRPEQAFESVERLQAQIKEDAAQVRAWFARHV